MTFSSAESAILRTVFFHEAWGYLPTLPELLSTLDVEFSSCSQVDVLNALEGLIQRGLLKHEAGRLGRMDVFEPFVHEIRKRDPLQSRKQRRARLVTRWLARLPGVRFVALANTTALGNARDGGDLDFFVVVRSGTMWMSRLLAVGPFKFLGWLPREDEERDAVCLSYFIADDGLDLFPHALPGDDPYFRHWFLALLPLFDDGLSSELWRCNERVRRRHPFARRWIPSPGLMISEPRFRFPLWLCRMGERWARMFQQRWFPQGIRQRMNQDTTVMVTDSVLKFHVSDGRETYRATYQELCQKFGITP